MELRRLMYGLNAQVICHAAFRFAVVSALSLLSACARTPANEQEPFGTRYANVAVLTADELTGIGRAESFGDRAADGILPGVAAGSVVGAVMGAAACGPFLYAICVMYGIIWGSYAGMAGGALLYSFSGVSDIDALYVNEVLSRLDQERDFQQELVSKVTQALPSQVLASPGDAEAQVIARLDEIEFEQRSKYQIRISAKGSLFFTERHGETTSLVDRREFRAESAYGELDHWLADDGRQLEAAIDACIRELSLAMSRTIATLTGVSAT